MFGGLTLLLLLCFFGGVGFFGGYLFILFVCFFGFFWGVIMLIFARTRTHLPHSL